MKESIHEWINEWMTWDLIEYLKSYFISKGRYFTHYIPKINWTVHSIAQPPLSSHLNSLKHVGSYESALWTVEWASSVVEVESMLQSYYLSSFPQHHCLRRSAALACAVCTILVILSVSMPSHLPSHPQNQSCSFSSEHWPIMQMDKSKRLVF